MVTVGVAGVGNIVVLITAKLPESNDVQLEVLVALTVYESPTVPPVITPNAPTDGPAGVKA
ncbi:hypothetical protein D3C85_839030 [compost metagenome]